MTKFFLDSEFVDDGKTIDLISIGLVCENGQEFYAINRECDFSKAGQWVNDNVLKSLDIEILPVSKIYQDNNTIKCCLSKSEIATQIMSFIRSNEECFGEPELWGEWCHYDYVAFCQLFGRMVDLPFPFPMRCNDILQWTEIHLDISLSELPPSLETEGQHNALLGARSVKASYDYLLELSKKKK